MGVGVGVGVGVGAKCFPNQVDLVRVQSAVSAEYSAHALSGHDLSDRTKRPRQALPGPYSAITTELYVLYVL